MAEGGDDIRRIKRDVAARALNSERKDSRGERNSAPLRKIERKTRRGK